MSKVELKKSHRLITSRMSLSPAGQDIIALISRELVKMNPGYDSRTAEEPPNNLAFSVRRKDLISDFGIAPKNLSENLDRGTDEVMGKFIKTKTDGGGWRKVQLVNTAEYNNGVLSVEAHQDLAMALFDYSKGFALVDFQLLLSLKSAYAKRILEMISRFKDRRESPYFQISLGDFEKLMGIGRNDVYERNTATTRGTIKKKGDKIFATFDQFKRTVIEGPLDSIAKSSNGYWFKSGAPDKKSKPTGFYISKSGKQYLDSDVITFCMSYIDNDKEREKIETLVSEVNAEDDYEKHLQKVNFMLDNGMGDRLTSDEIIKYEAICEVLNIPKNKNIPEV